ncbi:Hypothetical predicted protein [Pelobates cultripes]|uniref:NudC domain-containing protein 3 n=1 Tax=Pelobates cultripes TaxID=61616 RepID=A0AAD1RN87_PELCU|nr:Hypothetical predicted protein [Pelobates cultripes]
MLIFSQTFKTYERMALQDHEQRMQKLQAKLERKEPEEKRAETEQELVPGEEVVVETPEEEGHVEQEKAEREATDVEKKEDRAEVDGNSPGAAASMEMVQEDFQKDPDSYNGAVRKNYMWSQDYTDVEIKIPVNKDVIKGRQVTVDLQSTSIRVVVRDGEGEHVVMNGNFTHKINAETSFWSLEPGKCIVISLSKIGEYWWNAILEGEETIDIDKINKERSMACVDDEEHAVLDRLTFDYHQKLQGKPQSHEMKVHEMLKKGWEADGSPFKGQAFDPGMFNISPGAVQF